jgi:hypothetical protein
MNFPQNQNQNNIVFNNNFNNIFQFQNPPNQSSNNFNNNIFNNQPIDIIMKNNDNNFKPKKAVYKCNKCHKEIELDLKKDHELCHQLDENEKRVANMNLNDNRNNIRNNNNRQDQNRGYVVSPAHFPIIRMRNFNNRNQRILNENEPRVNRVIFRQNRDIINRIIRNRNVNNNIQINFPEIVIKDLNKLDEANKSCTICLDDFVNNEKVVALPCLHYFHKKCINKWMERKKECPICKFVLTQENINKKMKNIFH